MPEPGSVSRSLSIIATGRGRWLDAAGSADKG